MSSAAEEVVESDVCCANCGVAEVDDIKLEDCDGCDRKYCGDSCREVHREQHEGDCKIRAAKLHDDDLFEQPDGTHLGECPLCFLPMPLGPDKYAFWACCSTLSCGGCTYTHNKINGSRNCPFCREPAPDEETRRKMAMKRIKEANDPAAMRLMGGDRLSKGDYDAAVKYFTKAAELGDVGSHHWLGVMYLEGEGVEKDEEKAVYHAEKAAMGGHPTARHNLGCIEGNNGNIERSVKHFIIAANLGYEESMKSLWGYYKDGDITKEDLDATLRTHHAAIDEMKSKERDEAEAFINMLDAAAKLYK